jgi:hypothetical protein
MGDSAGAAEELMKNLGPNGLAKFQKMNVIQQEAYARSLGMGVDELADSLVKQKQLEELDKGQAKLLKKRIQELKEAGEVEKAAELEKQVLAGKNVELAEQQLDAQARIAQGVESRGGVGAQQAATQLASLRNELLQNQYDYGLKLLGIADNIAIGAIKTGLEADRYVGELTNKYFSNISRTVYGSAVQQG